MRRLRRGLVGSALLAGVSRTPLAAQGELRGEPCARPAPMRFALGETVRLDRTADYPCRLELVETGLVLKSDLAGSVPDPGSNVVMDSRGWIYSNSLSARGSVVVWRPDGTFARTVGREGGGPEEFQRGNFALWVDGRDRLHVLTGSLQWTVLSPALEWMSQTRSMPIMVDDDFTIVTDDGTVVTSAQAARRGAHWFGASDFRGNLVGTFGEFANGGVRSARGEDHLRMIGYGGGDRFWAGPERGSAAGYALELWGLDGRRHLTIERDVPWFRAGPGVPPARDQRPGPFVARVHADTSGLLIAMVVLATDAWLTSEQQAALTPERRREVAGLGYTAYLEVIDTRAGVVLASEHVPAREVNQLITRFLPGRMMAYRRVDMPDGLQEIRFLELRLTGSR